MTKYSGIDEQSNLARRIGGKLWQYCELLWLQETKPMTIVIDDSSIDQNKTEVTEHLFVAHVWKIYL